MAEAIIGRAHVPHLLHFHSCSNEAQVLREVWTFALLPSSRLFVDAQNIAHCNSMLMVLLFGDYMVRCIFEFFFFLFFVVNNDVFIVLRCGLRLTESINKAFKHFIYWIRLLFLMQRRMWGKMKLGLAWRESQISCFGFGWRKCFQHDVHTLATNWKQAARNYPWWC